MGDNRRIGELCEDRGFQSEYCEVKDVGIQDCGAEDTDIRYVKWKIRESGL
jgi:hypothetical protein